MGWEDRDYARDTKQGGWRGGYYAEHAGSATGRPGFSAWWFTTWLLALNIGVFLLSSMLGRGMMVIEGQGVAMARLDPWMYFSIDRAFTHLELWRLITFQFAHQNLMHLFGNMLGLYVFGYMIENYLGHARYIAFYLLCGVGGVAGYMFFAYSGLMQFNVAQPMVGASAGIFGILIAAVFLAPESRVMLLIPPIPIKLKYLAWGLLGFALWMVLSSGWNAGGQAAHLGGAAFGFLLIRKPELLNWADRLGKRVSGGGGVKITRTRAETGRGTAGGINTQPPRAETSPVDQREVDRILAKIGQQGMNSLTPQERATLDEASRKQG